MDNAIAITGMGMITAQGTGVEATWQGIAAARNVLAPWRGDHGMPPDHPLLKLAVAQCPTPPAPADLPPRLWNHLSRTQQLACIAVEEALSHARLPMKLQGIRVGLFLATTVCGMDLNEKFYAQYRTNKSTADAELIRRMQPYEVAALIARRHKITSDIMPQVCMTTCVGSAMAIAAAADALTLGECDIAIAGGSESLCRVVLSGFNALKIVSADGCRPFDKNRPGITVGEGAAVLIMERPENAAARGVEALAYFRGGGFSCDAHHLTAPDSAATYAATAIRQALGRAGENPEQVDYVNAHGTGTRDNDAMETAALRTVFEKVPAVSSTKRLTGHTFAAAGAIEAVICVEALRRGVMPANAGSVEADPALEIPVIRGAGLSKQIDVALSTNFAFGGNNAALVFSRSATSTLSPTFPVTSSTSAMGLGVVTDSFDNVGKLASALGVTSAMAERAKVLDAVVVEQHDVLAQLAIRAAHQALSAAGLLGEDGKALRGKGLQRGNGGALGNGTPGDDLALLFVSSWGNVDATVAYLESMYGAEGKFASPRHFSRSVFSSITSLAAIHFGIHGICETLAFTGDPVVGALERARRIVAAGRARHVLVIWGEQASDMATELSRIAVEKLKLPAYARYTEDLGWGTVAAVVGASDFTQRAAEDHRDSQRFLGRSFPMDGAVRWTADALLAAGK